MMCKILTPLEGVCLLLKLLGGIKSSRRREKLQLPGRSSCVSNERMGSEALRQEVQSRRSRGVDEGTTGTRTLILPLRILLLKMVEFLPKFLETQAVI